MLVSLEGFRQSFPRAIPENIPVGGFNSTIAACEKRWQWREPLQSFGCPNRILEAWGTVFLYESGSGHEGHFSKLLRTMDAHRDATTLTGFWVLGSSTQGEADLDPKPTAHRHEN